jgi:hypothetical protein
VSETIEEQVLARVRAWLTRTLPRIEELDDAELVITLRDTGSRDYSGPEARRPFEGGVPIVGAAVNETARSDHFSGLARALPPTEPPPARDAREVAAAAYAASEAARDDRSGEAKGSATGGSPDRLFTEARCEQRCSHGSRCTLPAGHALPDPHETEHGCVCYDDPPGCSHDGPAERVIAP